jgi:4-amino-4-deoxy-L-arabinose transferase-like glycosyltransferase
VRGKPDTLCWAVAGVLLGLMVTLMVAVSKQDSATVDETTFLGAGYTFWHGYRYYLVSDHPPLDQMLTAAPLLTMDLDHPDGANAILHRQAGYPWTLTWDCRIEAVSALFPQGRNNWYFWAMPEGQLFGQIFVYGGSNDGNAMLFRGRLVHVCFSLLTGIFVYAWARRLAGSVAALVSLIAYALNPLVLAYGHLIITDVGAMILIPIAVFAAGRFVESPNRRTALGAGAAVGGALVMKYTALALGPIVAALVIAYQVANIPGWRHWKTFLRNCAWAALAGWVILLIAYAPEWKPAPPISAEQAQQLGVPGWFQALRPILIPRDFFKGLAVGLAQAQHPRDAYFDGQWRVGGWWYYYPVALLLKVPIPLQILVAGALVLFFKKLRAQRFAVLTPWIAAGVYLLLATTSKVNIGVRHMLPLGPLLAVGMATQWTAGSHKWRIAAWVLAGWLGLETLLAYPLYIQYFNEFGGGSVNGYKYLIDSNYDWGQDANRLKQFLNRHQIKHIYLNYFGTQYSIEYLKIPNTRVSAEQAKQIQQGTLVVSVSELMRPEWAWLRQARQPVTRIAYTLFVYQFP